MKHIVLRAARAAVIVFLGALLALGLVHPHQASAEEKGGAGTSLSDCKLDPNSLGTDFKNTLSSAVFVGGLDSNTKKPYALKASQAIHDRLCSAAHGDEKSAECRLSFASASAEELSKVYWRPDLSRSEKLKRIAATYWARGFKHLFGVEISDTGGESAHIRSFFLDLTTRTIAFTTLSFPSHEAFCGEDEHGRNLCPAALDGIACSMSDLSHHAQRIAAKKDTEVTSEFALKFAMSECGFDPTRQGADFESRLASAAFVGVLDQNLRKPYASMSEQIIHDRLCGVLRAGEKSTDCRLPHVRDTADEFSQIFWNPHWSRTEKYERVAAIFKPRGIRHLLGVMVGEYGEGVSLDAYAMDLVTQTTVKRLFVLPPPHAICGGEKDARTLCPVALDWSVCSMLNNLAEGE